MGGYTKLNLKKDVEDQAPKFGFSPNLEFWLAGRPLDAEESAISYLRVAPGFRLPFGHSHERQEEIYVLVGGSARVKLDDEIVELGPWDGLRIAQDTVRDVEAGPEGAELLLFAAPRTGPGDAKMQQGWWTEDSQEGLAKQ
jgi:mannose-6-phosphate isomerase-like protein (cupin superfamily)